ncbi:unnamed protein product, partial [Clonostachys rosea f. rosea IK726]
CDGVTPECSHCKQKGKSCRYHFGDDKRRVSHRVAVDILFERIGQLQAFIAKHNLEPPEWNKESESVLSRLGFDHHLANEGLSNFANGQSHRERTQSNSPATPEDQLEQFAHISPKDQCRSRLDGVSIHASGPSSGIAVNGTPQFDETLNTGTSTNAVTNLDTSPPAMAVEQTMGDLQSGDWCSIDAETAISAPDLFNLSPEAYLQCHNPLALYEQSTFVPDVSCPSLSDGASSEIDAMEALVDQLSDRVGTLQISPDGQTRFYGPTSNFNLVDMPAPDNLTVHRTVRYDGSDYLERLGLEKEVPTELERHLSDLYFAWQDPSLHVVDQTMYAEAKRRWREEEEETPYYSESLCNAICALGAAFEPRYHPSFVTFPRSLADFFADRAKTLIEIELDCPSVATVQAMVVISGHDIGCKRDARGWLYSGMAMRLAFHLALHMDMTAYVERGILKPEEAEIRRTAFWGAYIADHLWGLLLGRPFRTNMEDVTVDKPKEIANMSSPQIWVQYCSAQPGNEGLSLADYTEIISRERISLCEIMAPLGYALYGCRTIPPTVLQEMNMKAVNDLLNWKNNLPQELQVDLENVKRPYLPHVLFLHMQYYQNMIHAHRPWMSRLGQPTPPKGPGCEHARMMCIESAATIGKLLYIYELQYSFKRMNIHGVGITCSAASLLIFASISNNTTLSPHDTACHLNACLRALDCFSSSWETAKKARDFLAMLQRKWGIQGRGGTVGKKRTRAPSLTRHLERHQSLKMHPTGHKNTVSAMGHEASIDLSWFLNDDSYIV